MEASSRRGLSKILAEAEKNAIAAALKEAQGDVAQAARALEISRATLRRLAAKHQLETPSPAADAP